MQKWCDITEADIAFCQHRDSWSGSFYELCFWYKRTMLEDDSALSNVMHVLWDDPSLVGIWKDLTLFGQKEFLQTEIVPAQYQHYYGYFCLSPQKGTGCASLVIREDDILQVVFYIPLGMLGSLFPVSYPLKKEKNLWMPEVNDILLKIGTRIYLTHPFFLAAIGEEAGVFPLKRLLSEITPGAAMLVPEKTFQQAGIQPVGGQVAEGLWWTDATEK